MFWIDINPFPDSNWLCSVGLKSAREKPCSSIANLKAFEHGQVWIIGPFPCISNIGARWNWKTREALPFPLRELLTLAPRASRVSQHRALYYPSVCYAGCSRVNFRSVRKRRGRGARDRTSRIPCPGPAPSASRLCVFLSIVAQDTSWAPVLRNVAISPSSRPLLTPVSHSYFPVPLPPSPTPVQNRWFKYSLNLKWGSGWDYWQIA